MEQFYDDVERALADSDAKYMISTGDFNTKKGTKTKGDDFKGMGAFGVGERNERGDRLTAFAEEHKPIANTQFQKQINKQSKQKTHHHHHHHHHNNNNNNKTQQKQPTAAARTSTTKPRYWTWKSLDGETRNSIDYA